MRSRFAVARAPTGAPATSRADSLARDRVARACRPRRATCEAVTLTRCVRASPMATRCRRRVALQRADWLDAAVAALERGDLSLTRSPTSRWPRARCVVERATPSWCRVACAVAKASDDADPRRRPRRAASRRVGARAGRAAPAAGAPVTRRAASRRRRARRRAGAAAAAGDGLRGIDDAASACSPTRSARGERICIVADYDADGATACAVGVRGAARARRRRSTSLVPNRFEHGYGLTPEIVDARRAAQRRRCSSPSTTASPASTASRRAQALGHRRADHRPPPAGRATLPGAPRASSIPNQPGCALPEQAHRRRRRDVLRAARAARASCASAARSTRARRAATSRAARPRRARHRRRRRAPRPRTTASSSRRACARIRAGRAHAGRRARCSRWPGRDAAPRDRASTWASSRARASTPPAASPT